MPVGGGQASLDPVLSHGKLTGRWLVMPDGGPDLRASEWDWILKGALQSDLEPVGSLTFVRGASAERVIEAFGMDQADALLLPAARAREAIRLPVWNDTMEVLHPWIRAGQTGEWAFAIDDGSTAWAENAEEIARELSLGTESVWFTWTPTIDYFFYFVDGAEVTAFEPLLPQDRRGTDPDRFTRQMRQTRLDPDTGPQPDPVSGQLPDTRICLLEMLTLALGIRLPRQVALGPLLTVQRGPDT